MGWAFLCEEDLNPLPFFLSLSSSIAALKRGPWIENCVLQSNLVYCLKQSASSFPLCGEKWAFSFSPTCNHPFQCFLFHSELSPFLPPKAAEATSNGEGRVKVPCSHLGAGEWGGRAGMLRFTVLYTEGVKAHP